MAKSLGEEEMVKYARFDGGKVSKSERKKISLLHARAASGLLRKKYGIRDEEILQAVRYHTTGAEGMGPLAKVLYIADKLEISREGVNPALRDLGRKADLDTLFAAVLDETVAWLRSREIDISAGTRRLLETIHNRGNG
jgi:nicotinate-nucleotide adenylyltransferase